MRTESRCEFSISGGVSVKKWTVVASTLIALTAAVMPAAAQQSLTWTAGAVGGGWYAISGGMAELLREKAQLNIKVIPGGGVQNPPLVQNGDADLGMGLPPLLQLAMNGDQDTYKGQKMPDL